MTADLISSAAASGSLPLWLLPENSLEAWLVDQPATVVQWARANQFAGERHRVLAVPGPDGKPSGALVGLGNLEVPDALSLWHAAPLPERLPAGTWHVATPLAAGAATQVALGWLTGAYRYLRYRSTPVTGHTMLVAPEGADVAYARAAARASALARDLVNAPANDLGPAELAQAAADLARQHGAAIEVVRGDALAAGYPLIHAVGCASARAPRLIDLTWGDPAAPRVTLVGKGVCFDSGGLDLKSSANMLLMKKDMGGAACALALADLLMQMKTRVRLRVLIPAVENAIGGTAYRPGDVLRSRKGLTVEIGNTDAEGRLILCDALHYARRFKPAAVVDIATLTGACVIALGAHHTGVMANDDALARELVECGRRADDRAWQLPLTEEYAEQLKSNFADMANVAGRDGGAITAGAFLGKFTRGMKWAHMDIAGTAYLSGAQKGSTGRPIGLLSEFLIQRATR